MTYQIKLSKVDHIAIAVKNIDEALAFYVDLLGFTLHTRREVRGKFSGMKSAELSAGKGFSIVLVQGTEPESQVCRYIEEFGPGIQHLAFAVENVEHVADQLKGQGLEFATQVLHGQSLVQIFTKRDQNSGMMIELIERRKANDDFEGDNIEMLFKQLEESNAY